MWEAYLNTPEDPAMSTNSVYSTRRVSHFFFSGLFLFFNHLGLNSQPSYCFSKPINKCFCGWSDNETWDRSWLRNKAANVQGSLFLPPLFAHHCFYHQLFKRKGILGLTQSTWLHNQKGRGTWKLSPFPFFACVQIDQTH